MMEFLMTMAVIALVFVAATIVVALIAGGIMKARGIVRKQTPGNIGSE